MENFVHTFSKFDTWFLNVSFVENVSASCGLLFVILKKKLIWPWGSLKLNKGFRFGFDILKDISSVRIIGKLSGVVTLFFYFLAPKFVSQYFPSWSISMCFMWGRIFLHTMNKSRIACSWLTVVVRCLVNDPL